MIPQSLLKLNHLNFCNIKPARREALSLFVFLVRLLLVIKSGLSLGASTQWLTNWFKANEPLESKQEDCTHQKRYK